MILEASEELASKKRAFMFVLWKIEEEGCWFYRTRVNIFSQRKEISFLTLQALVLAKLIKVMNKL